MQSKQKSRALWIACAKKIFENMLETEGRLPSNTWRPVPPTAVISIIFNNK